MKAVYISLGFMFLGIAYLGALIPGLPTTPWVLLASACFGKSSPRLERWLKKTPYFGGLIHDWQEHGGMRRSKKILSTAIIVPVVSTSAILAPVPDWVRWVIAGLGLVGVIVIWCVVPMARPVSPHRKLENPLPNHTP